MPELLAAADVAAGAVDDEFVRDPAADDAALLTGATADATEAADIMMAAGELPTGGAIVVGGTELTGATSEDAGRALDVARPWGAGRQDTERTNEAARKKLLVYIVR